MNKHIYCSPQYRIFFEEGYQTVTVLTYLVIIQDVTRKTKKTTQTGALEALEQTSTPTNV